MITKCLTRIILGILSLIFLLLPQRSWSLNLIDWPEYDPVGNEIFSPIEKAVPKLDLSGFIRNKTKIPFYQTIHNDFENKREDHLNIQRSEWLMQLAGEYRLNDETKFIGITHFLYDSAFDWDHKFRESFGESREKLQTYRQGKRILRELYMDTVGPDWNLRLGRQQVVWGKVDGAKIMDIINPEDFRDGPDGGPDWEYTRLPLWMLNYTKNFGQNSLQFLWIWELEPSIAPQTPSPWMMNSPFTPEKIYAFFPPAFPGRFFPFKLKTESSHLPAQNMENSEFALRYGFLAGGWDIHLAYFYTWKDLPTYFKRKTLMPILVFPPPPPGGTWNVTRPFTVVLEPTQTRIHQFGVNFDKSFHLPSFGKSIILRGEGVYNVNDYFQDVSDEKDGNSKHDWLKSGVAAEAEFGPKWWFTVRFDNNIINHWSKDLRTLPIGRRIERWERSLTFSISKIFYEDRATLLTYYVYGLNGSMYNSWWWRTQFALKLNSNWQFISGLSIFGGKDNTYFGQYERMDNAQIGLKYSF